MDGLQRISAIVRYLDNVFFLDNLKMLPQFNKKRFKDLDPLYQSKIERYQVSVYVIEPPTPERVKYDIFDRVNRGGTRLNSQEMRHESLDFAPLTLLAGPNSSGKSTVIQAILLGACICKQDNLVRLKEVVKPFSRFSEVYNRYENAASVEIRI